MAERPNNHDESIGGVPAEVAELIVRYYDNSLDEQGLSQLREALMLSEAARALFVRWGVQGELLSESLSADYQQQTDDMLMGSPKVLAELAELERQAQASMVQLHSFERPWYHNAWAIGAGSLAAVVAIALVLVIAFSGPSGSPPIVEGNRDAGEPGRDGPALKDAVATLTVERDVVWDRRPSDDLYAGDRFSLTQGIAEITTRSGAVAVVEAPATIELINHNALHLHAGRLVGICETETSKGFTVRTPHMDITDLGTRFGVDASAGGATEVHVFTGSVEATRLTDAAGQPERVLLKQGQAARASEANDGLIELESDRQRFAAMEWGSQPVFGGTGFGIAVGEKDPNWQIVAIGNDALDKPVLMGVSGHLASTRRLTNAAPDVKYLRRDERVVPDIDPYINDKRIRYTVRGLLTLPDDFEPSRDALGMSFEVDDRLVTLHVNGQELAVPANQYNQLDNKLYRLVIPGEHLMPGRNTVELEIEDLIRANSYVWGFGIAWHLDHAEQDQP